MYGKKKYCLLQAIIVLLLPFFNLQNIKKSPIYVRGFAFVLNTDTLRAAHRVISAVKLAFLMRKFCVKILIFKPLAQLYNSSQQT